MKTLIRLSGLVYILLCPCSISDGYHDVGFINTGVTALDL